MAVMDEYREEREAIKTAPFKKRVEYFFDYYKWHTIITIVVIAAVTGMIYELATAKDIGFYAAYINSYPDDGVDEIFAAEFAEIIELDTDKEEVIIDTTYFLDYVEQSGDHTTFVQKLVTLIAASTIDVLSGDENSMANLAYIGMLLEVDTYLTEEEIEAYGGELFYIDQAIVDIVSELDTSEEYPEYTYSTNPDDLEDPIAVGIVVQDGTLFTDNIGVSGEYIVIGIVANTTNYDESLLFVEYMLSED